MASIYVRGTNLWARYRDPAGKWVGAATGFKVGEEEQARRAAEMVQAGIPIPPRAPTIVTGPQHLYFVQSGAGGPVKIGYAKSHKQRVADMQVGNPSKLKALAVVLTVTPRQDEERLHRFCQSELIHGEWFRWSEFLHGVVEAAKSLASSSIVDRPAVRIIDILCAGPLDLELTE